MSRRCLRTAQLAASVLAVLTLGPASEAANPSPSIPEPSKPSLSSPAETISWTWSTVKPEPGQPRGYAQFERACAVCHGDGPAKPGTRALRAKYHDKEPALLAERTDLAPDYIRYVVRHGVSVMPPFRKTELSDPDLDELVAYLTRKRH